MKKYLQAAGVAITMVTSALPALAATGSAPAIGQVTSTDIKTVILNVIGWVLGIAGAVAVGFLIYGGLIYITGGAKGADTGKTIISNTLIGVAIIALSYVLVKAVTTAIGGGGVVGI